MRKLITLLLLASTFTFYAQEVPRQKVIVEVGTGTWCPSCPAVVHIIHDLIDAGANMTVVEYHINDPYQNQASLVRKDYYNFPWYPTTYYDSRHIGYDDWATFAVHEDYYETSSNEMSSFSVAINGEVGNNEVSGNVVIDKVAEYTGENLVMHLVLTESNIPEIWQGETELDFAERAMFPDGNGTLIDNTNGSTQEIAFNIPLDPSWLKENCELVFFIQDSDTNQIIQGDSVMLEDIITLSTDDVVANENNSYFYPNPAKNELFLYAEDFSTIADISINDMLGKTVMSQSEYAKFINIERLPAGVYLISYTENQEKKSAKFVKE